MNNLSKEQPAKPYYGVGLLRVAVAIAFQAKRDVVEGNGHAAEARAYLATSELARQVYALLDAPGGAPFGLQRWLTGRVSRARMAEDTIWLR